MPSMTSSRVNSACRSSGKLFFKKPIRHGCGLAFNRRSSRSQNSSGSTFAFTSSCMRLRTFFSTGFGSRVAKSIRFARNLRHFSLVLPCAALCVVVTLAVPVAVPALAVDTALWLLLMVVVFEVPVEAVAPVECCAGIV